MMRKWAALLSALLVVLGLTSMMSQSASAIPAWARKYNTSCSTCHEAFPRLNAVGEAFRMNGYRFPDDMYVKEEKAVLGQDAYKKVWPEAIWPSDIPGLPPVAFRMRGDWEFPVGGPRGRTASNNFNFPAETDILAGGSMGDNLSFFMEVAFEDGETSAMGWLQFQSVIGPENLFNFKAGDVGKHELGLLTARTENALTVTDYLYSSWQMPYPDATFDNTNAFMVANAQPGLELNGLGSRWRYAAGVVNGNDGSTHDNNSQKDVYLQTAWKFGGMGFDGSTGGAKAEGAAPPVAGRDDSFIVSLFGYDGTALVTPTGGPDSEDRFWRLGLGGKWYYSSFALGAGYAFGTNNDPYGSLASQSVDSKSWFVETEYVFYPWLIPSLRFETLSLDLPKNNGFGLQPQQDQQRFVASITALVRANVKVVLEGIFYVQNEVNSKQTPSQGTNNDDAVLIHLDFAF
jgi:hypothetical protein